jgi:hypothetical protein
MRHETPAHRTVIPPEAHAGLKKLAGQIKTKIRPVTTNCKAACPAFAALFLAADLNG